MYKINFRATKILTGKSIRGYWFSFDKPKCLLDAWKGTEKVIGEKLTNFYFFITSINAPIFEPHIKEE